MGTIRIPAEQMQKLVATGSARPLLPDHFPVPTLLEGAWWHVPEPAAGAQASETSNQPADFVPASDDQAALFDNLAERRREADRRVAASGDQQGNGAR